VKARVVSVRGKSPAKAVREHLAYLARDGADREGGRGRLFGASGELDPGDVDAFTDRGLSCRHQFRFIVSPERGGDLDLQRFGRDLMRHMEYDVGTKLDYVACVHHDTDQPHVHIVVNGRDARGGDLVISRDYIGNGLRHRSIELATNALGYRTELDVFESLARDVRADRFTALDRRLQTLSGRDANGLIDLRVAPAEPRAALQRRLYLGRVSHLKEMGLASEVVSGVWRLEPDALDRLRGHTQHRAIQRQVERHLNPGELAAAVEVLDKANLHGPIAGRVLGRGLANELTGTHYLVVAGTDGKTYYAALSTHSERHLTRGAHAGDIVMLSGVESGAKGHADRNIDDVSNRHGGVYDAQQHIEAIRGRRLPHEATPERYVEAHTLRLDALMSRGLVIRESEGRYRVPPDLLERLKTDPAPARDTTFIKVDVQGRELGAQIAARAFTWLDEQLVAGVPQQLRQVAVRTRFQNELIEAAEQRARRLVQLGFARIEGDSVRIDPHLKSKLTRLERDTAAERLSQQHGRFVDLDESRRFTGRVATIEALASGPHAVVVNEGRFTLVPADRGLSKLVGKDVSLSLASSPGRDAEQARVRFRVLDAMDLPPSLGPSLGR
jgi:type IV secretory pathway VirD2 relaxase